MKRPLRLYESQMLLLAKSCLICHRQHKVRSCDKCYSANYCSDHRRDFLIYHNPSCEKLLISLNYNITLVNCMSHLSNTFYLFPAKTRGTPSSMFDFIRLYSHFGDRKWAVRPLTTDLLSLFDYFDATYVTDPLTVYYGMQNVNLVHLLLSKPICVVDVISPIGENIEILLSWELFLHLLNDKVRRLHITFRSTEKTVETMESYRVNICSKCKSRKRVLTFRIYPMLYENYVFNTKYKRPRVIVGFHLRLSYLTEDCLTALQHQNCPLIFTTPSLITAKQLVTRINDVLGTDVRPLLIIKNNFDGLLSYMNFGIDSVCRRNNYLVIFKNLKDSNEPAQGCSRSCT
ncbi:hypothetical protein EAI_06161 [Harpegnathos saltator]|uniref:Mitochondrial splicing suppressor 51-like C-terminal domain-containing protein n=1 Tax=Harpegnathos saltator TaxID=610380 RepID=E2C9N8_HARSA|nr:hypothetical protein EAI_06161 [Harpegnathos saltator]